MSAADWDYQLYEYEERRTVVILEILHSDAGSLIYSSHVLPNSFTRTELLTAALHTNWRLVGTVLFSISVSAIKLETSTPTGISMSSNTSSSMDASMHDSIFLFEVLTSKLLLRWGIFTPITFWFPDIWNEYTKTIHVNSPPIAIMHRKGGNIVELPSDDVPFKNIHLERVCQQRDGQKLNREGSSS